MAWGAIKSARWRSFLTMLGIIIGVVSVVTIVSLGEGVKRQIAGEIKDIGPDIITVLPGVQDDNERGRLPVLGGQNTQILSDEDYRVIDQTDGVASVVPFSIVSGVAEADNREYPSGVIFGTNQDMLSALNLKVEYGAFFNEAEQNRAVVVIGKTVAEELFQENVPVGRTLTIRGQDFIVRGVLEEIKTSPLSTSPNYNEAILIPYPVATEIGGGVTPIYQIIVKPDDPKNSLAVKESIEQRLYFAHGNQTDVTVLTQQDLQNANSQVLGLLTQLITAVAAISLLVGGIGIMNIMLVAVSERTGEIGIRKAVGATNGQILGQFLVEAIVLSFAGGVIGVFIAIAVNFLIRIFTSLQPAVSPLVIALSVGVSVMVGIVFGIAPAIKAARKHPIDALRKM
jgi:putative ABC transport system permease protein